MYQDCFNVNDTNATLDQDPLLLQASYYPTMAAAQHVGHLYFNLPPTNQDLDLGIKSPYTDSTTWSSCSSSPSLDFKNLFSLNLQPNDIESFLLSDLPNNEITPQQQQKQYPQRQMKAFPCCTCPRSFARKHDLQRHVRVHTGVKPYSCLNCTKAFARTDALKRHLRMEETCRISPAIQAMKDTGSRRYRNL